MEMKNLKVAMKLGLGFGALFVIVLIAGLIQLNQLSGVTETWQEMAQVDLSKKDAIADAHIKLGEGIQNFKNYVLRGGDYNTRVLADMDAVGKIVEAYKATGKVLPEEQKVLDELPQHIQAYRDAVGTLTQLREKNASVTELDKAVKGADKPIAAALVSLSKIVDGEVNQTSTHFYQLLKEMRWALLATGAMVAILALIIT